MVRRIAGLANRRSSAMFPAAERNGICVPRSCSVAAPGNVTGRDGSLRPRRGRSGAGRASCSRPAQSASLLVPSAMSVVRECRVAVVSPLRAPTPSHRGSTTSRSIEVSKRGSCYRAGLCALAEGCVGRATRLAMAAVKGIGDRSKTQDEEPCRPVRGGSDLCTPDTDSDSRHNARPG